MFAGDISTTPRTGRVLIRPFRTDSFFPFSRNEHSCIVKVIIDQFVQAPILLALIIMGMSFMEGRGLTGMISDLKQQYASTLIQNCKFWRKKSTNLLTLSLCLLETFQLLSPVNSSCSNQHHSNNKGNFGFLQR